MYRCNECKKIFNIASSYEEKHGLDTPPYERIAVCPLCGAGDFDEYNITVEKIDIAEKLLPAIAALNRYWANIRDIYGEKSANSDFYEGISVLIEFMSELFPFISVETEKQISNMRTGNETERILLYLRG